MQQLACLKLPHRALRLPLSEEQQLLLCPGLNGEVYGEAGLGSYARVCVVELECLQFILHAATRWKLSTERSCGLSSRLYGRNGRLLR